VVSLTPKRNRGRQLDKLQMIGVDGGEEAGWKDRERARKRGGEGVVPAEENLIASGVDFR